MPMIKSGKQAIADAMNAEANLGLLPKHLIFGTPEVLEATGPDDSNTAVKVTATQDAPARGARAGAPCHSCVRSGRSAAPAGRCSPARDRGAPAVRA